VRNEPRSYPVVGQARCFHSAVRYKEISFFEQGGVSAFLKNALISGRAGSLAFNEALNETV